MVDQTHLFDDEGMRNFIINGYVTVQVDLPEVHESIYRQTEAIFETEGDPRNQILQKIPELHQVFSHPVVRGALISLLGPNYVMHPHRHAHLKLPGQKGGGWHQDGAPRGFTTKNNAWLFGWRRHHRFRSVWAWYYPQDVTAEMGPTGVLPGVQFYDMESMRHHDNAYGDAEVGAQLCGEAGTVTIGHYDQWHRSWGTNNSNRKRFMIKFLFNRTGEPRNASWNATAATSTEALRTQQAWSNQLATDASERHEPVWNNLWSWLSGRTVQPEPANGDENKTSSDIVPRLIPSLGDESAPVRLDASYALGAIGEPSVDGLIERLRDTAEPVHATDEPVLHHVACALGAIGAPAVPALLKVLNSDAAWWARASAADTLGDMGKAANMVVPALIKALEDDSAWVRRNAVNALGTIGEAACDTVPVLIGALRNEHPFVRSSAVSALVKMGKAAHKGATPAVSGAVERALAEVLYSDEYAIIREFADDALKQIGSPAD